MVVRQEIAVKVGELLFQFKSNEEWQAKATRWFRRAGHSSTDTLCLAADGVPILSGIGFRQAEERGAYPVSVYSIQEDE